VRGREGGRERARKRARARERVSVRSVVGVWVDLCEREGCQQTSTSPAGGSGSTEGRDGCTLPSRDSHRRPACLQPCAVPPAPDYVSLTETTLHFAYPRERERVRERGRGERHGRQRTADEEHRDSNAHSHKRNERNEPLQLFEMISRKARARSSHLPDACRVQIGHSPAVSSASMHQCTQARHSRVLHTALNSTVALQCLPALGSRRHI
jgi:hypothetical protein